MSVSGPKDLFSKFYSVADYIPFVSTGTNAVKLVAKKRLLKQESFGYKPQIQDHRYQYIKTKSTMRSVVLLFPFLGNILVGIYDVYHALKDKIVESGIRKEVGEEHQELCRKAFQGDVSAMVNLAALCKDKEAFFLYAKAAKAGDVFGMFQTGWRLLEGRGTAKNREEALLWLTQAEERGNSAAMVHLAQLYARDNTALSIDFLRKAERAKNPPGMTNRAIFIIDKTKGYPTTLEGIRFETGFEKGGQIDLNRAELCYREGASHGDSVAMVNLGALYEAARKYDDAAFWYKTAAELQNTTGMKNLLNLIETHKVRDELDEAQVVSWFKEIADNKQHAECGAANTILGWMKSLKGDHEAAQEYYKNIFGDTKGLMLQGKFKAAAVNGDPEGMYKYAVQWDTPQEETQKWLMRAAHAGHEKAMYQLGEKARSEGDFACAENWYRKALEGGNADSVDSLLALYSQTGPLANSGKTPQDCLIAIEEQCERNPKYLELWEKIAQIYLEGREGVSVNLEKSLRFGKSLLAKGLDDKIVQACKEKNDFSTMMRVADIFFEGDGVSKNVEKANKLYEELFDLCATMTNEEKVFPILGRLYEEGKGVEKNLDSAVECYAQARDALSVLRVGEQRLQENREKAVNNLDTAFRIFSSTQDIEHMKKIADIIAEKSSDTNYYGIINSTCREILHSEKSDKQFIARSMLIELLEKGKGGAEDLVEAYKLYQKQGDLAGMDRILQKMTSEQIETLTK